jgi:hypothetical protein
MIVVCKYCSIEFAKFDSEIKKHPTANHFCCKEHFDLYRGVKPDITLKCAQCGKDIIKAGSMENKRTNHFCSNTCYNDWRSINLRGENNYTWAGGITRPIYRKLRNCRLSTNWRIAIFERDNYTCTECGCTEHLDVHHTVEFADIIKQNNITTYAQGADCEQLWDVNNGITLCVHCHADKHPDLRHLFNKRIA